MKIPFRRSFSCDLHRESRETRAETSFFPGNLVGPVFQPRERVSRYRREGNICVGDQQSGGNDLQRSRWVSGRTTGPLVKVGNI